VAVVAVSAGVVAQQATPSGPIPPPPPYPGYTPPANSVPIVRSTPAARGKAKPSSGATETPAPPQFTNLSGIWEVEAQPGGAQTLYTHLRLQQNADNTITGYWERGKQELPFNGNFDGRQFKLVVQDGKTQTTFAGYEDNFSDMVGLIDKGDGKPVAFTASHRKKSDFLNGINIGPGIGGAAQGNGF
jgi:hypothetical protein